MARSVRVMSTSAERSRAARLAKKCAAGKGSPQDHADLESYRARRGRAGRPKRKPTEGIGTSPSSPAPADKEEPPPPPVARPAPVKPADDGADGHGAATIQVDLSGYAPASEAQALPGAPEAVADPAVVAAANAAVEREALCSGVATYIVDLMKACEPVIVEAKLPLPPVPAMVYPVVHKAWVVTLGKWLPQDVGSIEEHAEYVACGSTAYQLGLTYFGRRKLAAAAAAKPKPATAPVAAEPVRAPEAAPQAPVVAPAATPAEEKYEPHGFLGALAGVDAEEPS